MEFCRQLHVEIDGSGTVDEKVFTRDEVQEISGNLAELLNKCSNIETFAVTLGFYNEPNFPRFFDANCLAAISAMKNMVRLNLSTSHCFVKILESCPNKLKSLNLSKSMLPRVDHLQSLERLTLVKTKLTDEG